MHKQIWSLVYGAGGGRSDWWGQAFSVRSGSDRRTGIRPWLRSGRHLHFQPPRHVRSLIQTQYGEWPFSKDFLIVFTQHLFLYTIHQQQPEPRWAVRSAVAELAGCRRPWRTQRVGRRCAHNVRFSIMNSIFPVVLLTWWMDTDYLNISRNLVRLRGSPHGSSSAVRINTIAYFKAEGNWEWVLRTMLVCGADAVLLFCTLIVMSHVLTTNHEVARRFHCFGIWEDTKCWMICKHHWIK